MKANKWSKKCMFTVSPLEGNAASQYFSVVGSNSKLSKLLALKFSAPQA